MPGIVNPSETKAILKKHNIRLTKKLGQHFLIDANILRKQIEAARLSADDTVVEVGPGIGTLTEALSGVAGRVIAVEYDPRFVQVLKETLAGKDNVEIIRADAMDLDLGGLGANKLVANLPYNVGTAVLQKVLEEALVISEMTVMLQKEVAARLVAPPGAKEYGVLAIAAACYADTRIIADVKKTSFLPPPAVDSSLVSLERRAEPLFGQDTRGFIEFVKTIFTYRRKTLKKAAAIACGAETEKAEVLVADAGLEPSERAENLSPERLFALYRVYNACKC